MMALPGDEIDPEDGEWLDRHFADHIFCLVRTDASGKPQAGITFLLIPMSTRGISVKPMVSSMPMRPLRSPTLT